MLVEDRRVCCDYRKACTGLEVVLDVRFDCRKAWWRLVEDRRVGFNYRKACKMLAAVGRVRLEYCHACRAPIEIWSVFCLLQGVLEDVNVRRVCFDYRKSCWRLVEARRVCLDYCQACIERVWGL